MTDHLRNLRFETDRFVCEVHGWSGSLPCPGPGCWEHYRFRQASSLHVRDLVVVSDPAPIPFRVAEWGRRLWAIETPAGCATARQWVPLNADANEMVEIMNYHPIGRLPGVVGIVRASEMLAWGRREGMRRALPMARAIAFNEAIDRIGPWIGGALMAGTLLWAWLFASGWPP